jgi:hypothetical protein
VHELSPKEGVGNAGCRRTRSFQPSHIAAVTITEAPTERSSLLDRILQLLTGVVDFLTKHLGTWQYGPISTVISARMTAKAARPGPFSTTDCPGCPILQHADEKIRIGE